MADKTEKVTENETTEGFLMKKGKRSFRWKRVFAKVEEGKMVYGYGNEEGKDKLPDITKCIELNGAVIKDLEEEEGKTHQFTIKPQSMNGNRTFHFSTSSEDEHKKWLQALCIARMSEKQKSQNSEACVIQ